MRVLGDIGVTHLWIRQRCLDLPVMNAVGHVIVGANNEVSASIERGFFLLRKSCDFPEFEVKRSFTVASCVVKCKLLRQRLIVSM